MSLNNWHTNDDAFKKVSPKGSPLGDGSSLQPVKSLHTALTLWGDIANMGIELAQASYADTLELTNNGSLHLLGTPKAIFKSEEAASTWLRIEGNDYHVKLENLTFYNFDTIVYQSTVRETCELNLLNTIIDGHIQKSLLYFRMTTNFDQVLCRQVIADLRNIGYCDQSTFINSTIRFRNRGDAAIQNSIFVDSVLIFENSIKPIKNCLFIGETYFGTEVIDSQVFSASDGLEVGQKYYVKTGSITINDQSYEKYHHFEYNGGDINGNATLVKIYNYEEFQLVFFQQEILTQLSFEVCGLATIEETFVNFEKRDLLLKPNAQAATMGNHGQYIGKYGVGISKLAGHQVPGAKLSNMKFDNQEGYLPIDPLKAGFIEFPMLTNTSAQRALKCIHLLSNETTNADILSFSSTSSATDILLRGNYLPFIIPLPASIRLFVNGYTAIRIQHEDGSQTVIQDQEGYTTQPNDQLVELIGGSEQSKVEIISEMVARQYVEIKLSNNSMVDCDQQAYQKVPVQEQIYIDKNGILSGEATFDSTSKKMVNWSFMRIRVSYQPTKYKLCQVYLVFR